MDKKQVIRTMRLDAVLRIKIDADVYRKMPNDEWTHANIESSIAIWKRADELEKEIACNCKNT